MHLQYRVSMRIPMRIYYIDNQYVYLNRDVKK